MNYGFKGGTTIRSYDVARDTFGKSGPKPDTQIGQCDQLVHDAKHDVVVYADTWNARKTFLYDRRTDTWSDGGPTPKLDKAGGNVQVYINRVYDPQVGVIMIMPSGGAMKTFAYDVAAKNWRDLDPQGSAKVPFCTIPGIAYDSRNRAVILIKSDHNASDALSGQVHILDLATNTWKPGAQLPAKSCLNMGAATYDANHNLLLCATGGKLWFYRYKGGCPADAFLAKELK